MNGSIDANRNRVPKTIFLSPTVATDIQSDTSAYIVYMSSKTLQDVEQVVGLLTGKVFDY